MQKSSTPRFLHHRAVTLLLFAATWCVAISTSAHADVVADWNVTPSTPSPLQVGPAPL